MQKTALYKEKKGNTHWIFLLKITALDEPHEGHLEMQAKKFKQHKNFVGKVKGKTVGVWGKETLSI